VVHALKPSIISHELTCVMHHISSIAMKSIRALFMHTCPLNLVYMLIEYTDTCIPTTIATNISTGVSTIHKIQHSGSGLRDQYTCSTPQMQACYGALKNFCTNSIQS